MPTDRSLWVEDKYALRCRGCGEKFTMFRRRHHCRRCGQVFCYECLHNAQPASGSQSFVDNVYEWLAPSPTRAAHPLTEAATTCGTPSSTPVPASSSAPIPVPANIAAVLDESVQAELATRLCRRCAATIIEMAEREAAAVSTGPASRLEFRPSSNTTTSASQLLSPSFSPAAASPLSMSVSNFNTPLRHTLATTATAIALSEPSTSPMAGERSMSLTSSLAHALQSEVAGEKEGTAAWRTRHHAETVEEKGVTYSIGNVHHRVPATMAQWWSAHQKGMRAKEHHRLTEASTRLSSNGAKYVVSTAGAKVHVLASAIDFSPAFRTREASPMSTSAEKQSDWACDGSAAAHDETTLTPEECRLLDGFSAACKTHLLSRLKLLVETALPGNRFSHLSHHLAAMAWWVVQRTTVAIGSTVAEHVSAFSVPCPAVPLQCTVYPGLLCSQRLPSKREMTPCDHPRVLLLAGHLTYPVQPAEDLVDYVRSYSGYLDKLFQRLTVWSPDVIVVEGGMHHYLRECIEKDGRMRLLLHVGRDFLVQLSWCLQADIIADLQYVSVGELASTTPMGSCARFEVMELAEDAFFCGFAGLASVCFHTLVFRGNGTCPNAAGGAGTRAGVDGGSTQPLWAALEQLGSDAVVAAYHAAMQSHWMLALLRGAGKPPFDVGAMTSSATTEANTAAASLTLNLGCCYPPEVVAACRDAGAAASLVRDTLVLNVVHMDHLFEGDGSNSNTAAGTGSGNGGSGNGGGGPAGGGSKASVAAASPASALGTLTRARSSDFAVDAAPPRSNPSSTGTSRTDLASMLSAGLNTGGAAAGAAHARGTEASSASSPHAYSVVQQKAALTFYGGGDDNLFTFLISRCTTAESQLLYLHGGHRVRVAVTTTPKIRQPQQQQGNGGGAAAGGSTNSSNRGSVATPPAAPAPTTPPLPAAERSRAFEEAQQLAIHSAAVRQNASRALAAADVIDASSMACLLTFLRGSFALHISSGHAPGREGYPSGATDTVSAVDVSIPVCPPHLLNFSLAAFLEWVLYGWMSHLASGKESGVLSTQPVLPPPQVRVTFTFHRTPASAVGATATTVATASVGDLRDVVTLTIDPVPLLHIRYPHATLPMRPTAAATLSDAISPVDVWYAAHDADELEGLLRGFHCSLKAAADGMRLPPPVPKSGSAEKLAEGTAVSPLSKAHATPEKSVVAFVQLCERAKAAVEALRDSQARGGADVAMFLRPLRQHLLPTLMSEYRAWQAEARRAPSSSSAFRSATASSSSSVAAAALPTLTSSRDAADMPALTATADRGVLRSFEDCYFHPERPQWVRLGEPSSVLSAALQLLYGDGAGAVSASDPSSPVSSGDARTFPRRASASAGPSSPQLSTAAAGGGSAGTATTTTTAAAAATPSSPHVSFAVGSERPQASPARSSFASMFSSAAAAAVAAPAVGSPTLSEKQRLMSVPRMTRAEALEVLRQGCGKADASRPAAVACTLRGYRPVLPGTRSAAAVSAVSALVEAGTTGASAIMNLASGSSSAGGGGGGGANGSGGAFNNGSGSSTSGSLNSFGAELGVTVEVLFPHAFAALHVLYTNGAPLDLAASLLRCRPFMTDGGKSQSRFFVTEDGRFLVKSVKPMELRYFREWAPRYFARMAAYYASPPSPTAPASAGPPGPSQPSNLFTAQCTLGKILGLYVVHVQGTRSRAAADTASSLHPQPPTPSQQQQHQHQQPSSSPQPLRTFLPDGTHCFMVAEQLLFQRPVRETWDLKGSQRNRTTEQTAAVRLDVDFVQERLRRGDFFFCTPEGKSLLMDHLARDTQLLADSGIMDYSLMASVSRDVGGDGRGSVYVGMIDFLHPYSSAKVLESKMKSGLDTVLGYGRRDPTIIDPSSYAARFMLWMDGYFNGVPDRLFPLTRVRQLTEKRESAEVDDRVVDS